jgi:hypothetical protein
MVSVGIIMIMMSSGALLMLVLEAGTFHASSSSSHSVAPVAAHDTTFK